MAQKHRKSEERTGRSISTTRLELAWTVLPSVGYPMYTDWANAVPNSNVGKARMLESFMLL